MKTMRITILALVFAAAGAAAPRAQGINSALLRSLLLPGAGQAHEGHYTKAALFAAGGVLSGAGVFISQIHYNRAVEKYENNKSDYLALGERVRSGELVNYGDIQETYAAMEKAFNQAETRYKWRNIFLGALIGNYVLNVIDILMSEPAVDKGEALSIDARSGGFMLIKTISF